MRPVDTLVKLLLIGAGIYAAATIWQAEKPGTDTRRAFVTNHPDIAGWTDAGVANLSAAGNDLKSAAADNISMLGRDLSRDLYSFSVSLGGGSTTSTSAAPARQSAAASAPPAPPPGQPIPDPAGWNDMMKYLKAPIRQPVAQPAGGS